MPVSSLPSKYGIGTIGKEAYKFIDFLVASGQKYWQMLPLGSTSYGDSPYQSFSTFAGNPYFVDLEMLISDGLLLKKEVESYSWGDDEENVDYGIIYENRFKVLRVAAKRGIEKYEGPFKAFVRKNKDWVKNYALFMALKKHFGEVSWTEWPDEDIRLHKDKACKKYQKELKEDVEFFEFVQFLFFKQWKQLKAYARKNRIEIIGDLPIYVALDSADVWAEAGWFQLDEENTPVAVAGVPPDYFSADGQLWGNPLYDWDKMKKDGYGWWIRRVEGAFMLYDVLRIDHFRGFESYWSVPYGEKTARKGKWVKGPGMDLVGLLAERFADKAFIAEDLGFMTPEVKKLQQDSGFPGMKVLEFAFDSREESDYLPHTYGKHCICYTGTHDNSPIALWRYEADKADVALAVEYLGINEKEGFNWGFIRGGMSSVAELFVAQMQDYLELGKGYRINIPGTLGGNWTWRMKKGAASAKLAKKIARIVKIYGRSQAKKSKKK